MVTLDTGKYCHGYTVNVAMVTQVMLPWLHRLCCHGYTGNVAMVTQVMLPWLHRLRSLVLPWLPHRFKVHPYVAMVTQVRSLMLPFFES